MSERLALAVFVKNEERDIAWWLGWHIALGFTTICVYDDDSTDRTADIVKAAAKSFDVRLETSEKSIRFNHRQKFTYEKAISDAKNKFDWLMFLDSDEYLDLGENQDLSAFLNKFPEASAIAINWCCFGSSGYITRPPNSSPFESYIRGSHPDSLDANKIVKSIFRLDRTSSRYINPHHFDVEGLYVSSDGTEMQWDAVHPERTQSYPSWANARVRHYACRSLADFLDKVERRSDIRDAPTPMNYFKDFDINETLDPPADDFLLRVRKIVRQIRQNYELSIYSEIKKKQPWKPYAGTVDFQVYEIRSIHSSKASLDRKSGNLVSITEEADSERYTPVYGIIVEDDPTTLYLTCVSQSDFIHIPFDDRFGTIIPLKIEAAEGDNFNVGLRNPHSGRSICWFAPDSQTQCGEVQCNRQWIHAWEQIHFHRLDVFPEEINETVAKLTRFSQPQSYSEHIQAEESDAAFAFLSSRSQEEQITWAKEFNITLPKWMENSPKITL
ncbi:glycosyltransferase [Gluconobacter japonicus]|nr:glycosyltransferase [Gluconobacter japonicus]